MLDQMERGYVVNMGRTDRDREMLSNIDASFMDVKKMLRLANALRKGIHGFEFDMEQVLTSCGSAGCIAGHAIKMFSDGYAEMEGACYKDLTEARLLLGLSGSQADYLFTPALPDIESGVIPMVPGNYSHEFYHQENAALAVELMAHADNPHPWNTLWAHQCWD